MTETTSTSTMNGVDLAQVPLRNARAVAKGAPQTLGSAINRMMPERGLEPVPPPGACGAPC